MLAGFLLKRAPCCRSCWAGIFEAFWRPLGTLWGTTKLFFSQDLPTHTKETQPTPNAQNLVPPVAPLVVVLGYLGVLSGASYHALAPPRQVIFISWGRRPTSQPPASQPGVPHEAPGAASQPTRQAASQFSIRIGIENPWFPTRKSRPVGPTML